MCTLCWHVLVYGKMSELQENLDQLVLSVTCKPWCAESGGMIHILL